MGVFRESRTAWAWARLTLSGKSAGGSPRVRTRYLGLCLRDRAFDVSSGRRFALIALGFVAMAYRLFFRVRFPTQERNAGRGRPTNV